MSATPMSTQDLLKEVTRTCESHGSDSIIVLSGVPATGKTHIARKAAIALTGHDRFIEELQFHPGYSYEEFVDGLFPNTTGGFVPRLGVFTAHNKAAERDSNRSQKYVLLIEEFTRANLTSVLGEILTYVEYRGAKARSFRTLVQREPVVIQENLIILATMNPRDRSALELDDALLRRMRIVECPPSPAQLREMLNGVDATVLDQLEKLFVDTRKANEDLFDTMMPFGHGIFDGVRDAGDLRRLWHQRIKHLLYRPNGVAHPFADEIRDLYPWRDG